MNLSGEYTLPVPLERAWDTLVDPTVLAHCLPGCQEFRLVDPDTPDIYAVTLSLGIAAIRGIYKGTVRLSDQESLVGYRLEVRGGGDKGIITGAGRVEFAPLDGKTLVRYAGDYHVAGPIASVGQRLFQPVANLLTTQFFRCVEQRLASSTPAA